LAISWMPSTAAKGRPQPSRRVHPIGGNAKSTWARSPRRIQLAGFIGSRNWLPRTEASLNPSADRPCVSGRRHNSPYRKLYCNTIGAEEAVLAGGPGGVGVGYALRTGTS
jgi:hypothetical protein